MTPVCRVWWGEKMFPCTYADLTQCIGQLSRMSDVPRFTQEDESLRAFVHKGETYLDLYITDAEMSALMQVLAPEEKTMTDTRTRLTTLLTQIGGTPTAAMDDDALQEMLRVSIARLMHPSPVGHEYNRQMAIRHLTDLSRVLSEMAMELALNPERFQVEALIEIHGMVRAMDLGLQDLSDDHHPQRRRP